MSFLSPELKNFGREVGKVVVSTFDKWLMSWFYLFCGAAIAMALIEVKTGLDLKPHTEEVAYTLAVCAAGYCVLSFAIDKLPKIGVLRHSKSN